MIEECRHIWERVFDDSEEFVDLYFSRRYSAENTFVAKADGRIVAQAQCLSYKMTASFGEPILNVGYVSGLATLPEYRGQGHAKSVMQQMHQWLSDHGYDYCLLIPADNDAAAWYARHFGYKPCTTKRKQLLSAKQMADYTKLSELTPHLIYTIQRDLVATPYTVQHTADDLADQLAVCQMSGGGLYTTPDGLLMAERVSGNDDYLVLDSFGNAIHSSLITQSLFLPICNKSPLPHTIRMTLMLE
ncbi:MAG: GNAT family N-acetyltransferase [Bacteroidaceae bacterium]|nr:GNAT family N-acetyltransferase [Bacteroidaceae bacterium]